MTFVNVYFLSMKEITQAGQIVEVQCFTVQLFLKQKQPIVMFVLQPTSSKFPTAS